MENAAKPIAVKKTYASKRSIWRFRLESLVSGFIVFSFLFMMLLIEVLPVSWTFSTSLRPAAEAYTLPPSFFPTYWIWDNYWKVLTMTDIPFMGFFINSLRISIAVTVGQLITCSMAAFAFARLRFPGRDTIFFLYLATMMVPGSVTGIPVFIIIRNLNLIDNHAALIIPGLTSALGTFLLRQFFMSLPNELMDAARIDGAGFFRIYAAIFLPLVGPGLSALGIFTFLGSWHNFYGPLLYMRSWEKFTLPIAIAVLPYLGKYNMPQTLALIILSIVPILLLFLVGQRFVIKGIAMTGLKG